MVRGFSHLGAASLWCQHNKKQVLDMVPHRGDRDGTAGTSSEGLALALVFAASFRLLTLLNSVLL
jgi:hypothetical protein